MFVAISDALYYSYDCCYCVVAQVNPSIVGQLESHGMTFVGHDVEAQRMEIMELQGATLVMLSDTL